MGCLLTTPGEAFELPALKRMVACHRHHKPSYDRPLNNLPILKVIGAVWKKFSWKKCQPMVELRKNGGAICTRVYKDGTKRFRIIKPRRANMRSEREQTLNALVPAMLNHVEYDHSADFIYECMLSEEELAREIGQLHLYEPGYDSNDEDNGQYRHGRISCDPVRGAMDDLEASKLVFVVRDFDHDTGQYKSSRIFLTPLLFQSLGMSGKDTKKFMAMHSRYKKKHKKKYRRTRPLSDRIANITKKSLLNVLDYHKRWFNGELEPEYLEEKRQVKVKGVKQGQRHSKGPIDLSKVKKPSKESVPGDQAEAVKKRYIELTTNSGVSRGDVYRAEHAISAEHPDADTTERYRLIIERLSH